VALEKVQSRQPHHTLHASHPYTQPTPNNPQPTNLRELDFQSALLHLAAVNSAPAALTSNPTALAAWGLRLANRAHALRVVAGGIRGWALEVGPGAQVLELGARGCGLALVQALVAARSGGGGKAAGGGKKQSKAPKQQRRHGDDDDDDEEEEEERAVCKTPKLQQLNGSVGGSALKTPGAGKSKAHAAAAAAAAGAGRTPAAAIGKKQPKGTPDAARQVAAAAPSTTKKRRNQEEQHAVAAKPVKTPKAKGSAAAAAAATPAAAEAPATKRARAAGVSLMTPQPVKAGGVKGGGKKRVSL